jgi:hypothetical protein
MVQIAWNGRMIAPQVPTTEDQSRTVRIEWRTIHLRNEPAQNRLNKTGAQGT